MSLNIYWCTTVVCVSQGTLKFRQIKYDWAANLLLRSHFIGEGALLAWKWHKSQEAGSRKRKFWSLNKAFTPDLREKKTTKPPGLLIKLLSSKSFENWGATLLRDGGRPDGLKVSFAIRCSAHWVEDGPEPRRVKWELLSSQATQSSL